MLTVLLECKDSEPELAYTLAVLVSGAVDGVVSEVIVLDHGSNDGTAKVADAAGCKYLQSWKLDETARSARGDWLLFLEPGARPQSGWVEEVVEYASLGRRAARFSPSSRFRRPWLKRLMRKKPPLEHGLLVRKRDFLSALKPHMDILHFARAVSTGRLRSELIPAWVVRERA